MWINVFVRIQIPKDRLSFSQATLMHSKWQSELFQTKCSSLPFLLFPSIYGGLWKIKHTLIVQCTCESTGHLHHLRQISSGGSFFSGTFNRQSSTFEFCSSVHHNNLNLFFGQKSWKPNQTQPPPLPSKWERQKTNTSYRLFRRKSIKWWDKDSSFINLRRKLYLWISTTFLECNSTF